MSCYFRDGNLKTFADAQANCKLKQANLVTVNDIYEQNFLNTFMGSSGGWNGLNSLNGTNNTFGWISGDKVNFTYWMKDHPNTKYHCAHMYKKMNFKWHTKACSTKHKSICEKGLLRLFSCYRNYRIIKESASSTRCRCFLFSRKPHWHWRDRNKYYSSQNFFSIFVLDCSKSPIFSWDRWDIARFTFNDGNLDFQMYQGGWRRGL